MSMETSTDSTRPSSSVPYIFGETLTGLTVNEEMYVGIKLKNSYK